VRLPLWRRVHRVERAAPAPRRAARPRPATRQRRAAAAKPARHGERSREDRGAAPGQRVFHRCGGRQDLPPSRGRRQDRPATCGARDAELLQPLVGDRRGGRFGHGSSHQGRDGDLGGRRASGAGAACLPNALSAALLLDKAVRASTVRPAAGGCRDACSGNRGGSC